MKRKLAQRLRIWADRLDYDTAYVHSEFTFRIIRGKGIQIHQFEHGIPTNVRDYGTPLFYRPIDYKGIENE